MFLPEARIMFFLVLALQGFGVRLEHMALVPMLLMLAALELVECIALTAPNEAMRSWQSRTQSGCRLRRNFTPT